MPSWILRFHSFIPFYANHANNILRVEDSEGQEREQFEYEYNDQDYPIKVTETYLRPSKFRKANSYHTPYYTRLKKAVDDDVYEFSIQYIEAK